MKGFLKKFLPISLLFIFGCVGVQIQATKETNLSESIKSIAILEFNDARMSKEKEKYDNPAQIIQEKLISQLANQGKLRVIERTQIEEILAEQKMQISGLVDNATAQEIGKIIGVDGLMLGSITEYGRTIYPKAKLSVSVRVVEVKTGLIKWAKEIKVRKTNYAYPIELLKDIIDETIDRMVKEIK